MSKILNRQFFGAMALVLAIGLFAPQAKSSDTPYLKLVGPTPLRFEVVIPNTPLFIKELALPKPNNRDAQEAATTNKAAADKDGSKQAAGSAEGDAAENSWGSFGGPEKNAGNGANAASGMLNITPRMITEYLKPDRSEDPNAGAGSFQPGQSILVPAELGFVPPMPGGSRAIYISK